MVGEPLRRRAWRQTIHVHQVLRGAYFAPDEPLEFTRLIVQMDWLAYWVFQLGGIENSSAAQSGWGAALRGWLH